MTFFDASVDFLFGSLLSHPGFYLGAFLACIGAMGFVLFAANTAAGLMPALKKTGDVEEIDHMRLRAVWGVCLMIGAFVVWELLDALFAWIGRLFS